MCGIAGIVSVGRAPVEPEAIKRMCDVVAHRGPDDAGYVLFRDGEGRPGDGGYWCSFADPAFRHINEHLPVWGDGFYQGEVDKNRFTLALGHRRLSIIDLSHYGHQPMTSSDRRFWVVFNGEIYNFPTLRDELIAEGHIFRTTNDTEVLLHLWEDYNIEALSVLDGMFSLAIYDRVENVLTLARDRFGVKPLYYSWSGEHLVFASETKAILASGLVEPTLDPNGLVEYFTFQNTFGARTLFKGVNILLPGQCLNFRPGEGREAAPRQWFGGFPEIDPSLTAGPALQDRVANSFDAAVQRQLISDVEVGSYLSGGMDSGSIVAVAGRSIPRLLTFTGGFDLTNVNGIEQGFDERKLAEQLSYLLQTEHYSVVLHAGDMPAAMEKLTWHMDDPRAGMCHPNWYMAKLAGRFVKVCLSGTGGDELFAGYPWRYRRGLDSASVDEFDEANFRFWHRFLPPDEMPGLFSGELRDCGSVARESYGTVLENAPAYRDDLSLDDNLVHRALYLEFKTFLHGLLIMEDHVSMAHGLETRVPFLDNALADLGWSISPSAKLKMNELKDTDSGRLRTSVDGKTILRRAMARFLPESFTQQPKQGFSPPDENWFRGPSMDYIKDILLDRRTLERPWFNQEFVRGKLDDHFEGRRNHRLLIWSLLSVEWLQRHYIDQAV